MRKKYCKHKFNLKLGSRYLDAFEDKEYNQDFVFKCKKCDHIKELRGYWKANKRGVIDAISNIKGVQLVHKNNAKTFTFN